MAKKKRTKASSRQSPRYRASADARVAEFSAIPCETQERFRAVADYTYDWETWVGPDGKPLWINPAVERMTGYSVDECLEMPDYPLPLIVAEDRPAVVQAFRGYGGGSGNDVSFRILRKNGTHCWAAISWQPFQATDGASLGARTSVRDITKRRQAEERLLIAFEKAEQANLAKSKFLAAASHDLRQPLQAIGMFLSTLRFTATDPESREVIDNLDDCLKATSGLLNSLLEISRLDAGMLEPRRTEFLVEELIDQLTVEYAQLAFGHGIDFRVVKCTAAVRSDPTLLERILRNLADNALHHAPSGRILLGCRRRPDNVEIQVWDSGEGIPEDQLEKIFEEFYQLGNPERDRRRGLGLGLSIVKRVADLLGHPVNVSSRLGKGSVFSILVPLADKAPEPASVGFGEAPLTAATILVIDDDPVLLKAMGGLFSHWGCRAILAASLVEARDKLMAGEVPPDLILSDYRLGGGLNGADAIREIQEQLGATIPGVILTGDTEPRRLREARKSGFALVHKPVDSEKLRAALGRTLQEAAGGRSNPLRGHHDTNGP